MLVTFKLHISHPKRAFGTTKDQIIIRHVDIFRPLFRILKPENAFVYLLCFSKRSLMMPNNNDDDDTTTITTTTTTKNDNNANNNANDNSTTTTNNNNNDNAYHCNDINYND